MKDLVNKIASGSLTEDEQLALLKQVETSVLLAKQAKQVQQELSVFEQAADVISSTIKQHKKEVSAALAEVQQYVRQPGPKGQDGKAGRDGKDGVGKDGRDGRNGLDGKDGAEGKDGVSIVDVYWAADDSLVCVLSDGREIDTGPLLGAGTGGNTSVTNSWSGYSTEELKTTFIYNTFETVNKNLASSNGVLGYTGSDLTTITYANGILKTLAYDAGGDLLSVTLSGATPEGIKLIKTFSYTSGELSSFVYT
jgi:hypothetical protein